MSQSSYARKQLTWWSYPFYIADLCSPDEGQRLDVPNFLDNLSHIPPQLCLVLFNVSNGKA